MHIGRLTKLDDFGSDIGDKDRKVLIDQPTHVGRLPVENASFSLVLPSQLVSRCHAMIIPTEGDFFTIKDVGSLNGTYVDGVKLLPNTLHTLKPNERCFFGPHGFLFDFMERELGKNQALIVTNSGGNLRGTSRDAIDLKVALENRDFNGRIRTLTEERANVKNVLTAIENLKYSATNQGTSLFYFSGHGDKKGNLILGAGHSKERLTPAMLRQALEGMRGKLLLILDGCFTAAMTAKLDLEHMAVIGNENEAYEGATQSFSPGVLSGDIRGNMTGAIVNILKEDRGNIDMGTLIARLKENGKIVAGGQKVVLASNTIIRFPTCPW